jgi:membrane protein required for colicin V production
MAIMRGLSREVLSLVAWGAAAVAAFYAIFSEPVRKQATDLLKPYIGENDVVVTIAVAGAVFLVVLIVLSIKAYTFDYDNWEFNDFGANNWRSYSAGGWVFFNPAD